MMRLESYESISMLEFLINYVEIEAIDEVSLSNLRRATHRDIKELRIPYVKAVPFECVTNEDVLEGRIIIVHDVKGRQKRIAPYIRPEILKKEETKRNEGYARRIVFKESK